MKKIKNFKDFVTNENLYMPDVEHTPVLKGTSFDIKYPHNKFKIGEQVKVSIYASKYPGKTGIIAPPTKLGKKENNVKIDFIDGSSAYVPITDISRI